MGYSFGRILLGWLATRYDTDDKKLNVVRGPKHDYLGMNLDFSTPGTVQIDMTPYINKIVAAFPEKITGVQCSQWGKEPPQAIREK